MTKTKRKQIVGVLTKVLAALPSTVLEQGSPYICDNVYYVTTNEMTTKIKAIINERIGYRYSIEGWLKDQSDVIAEQVRHDVMFNKGRKLQEYRKAWVRELIKEFSA